MIILKSTSDFEIKGHKYPDFPLLTWSQTNPTLDIQAGMLFEEGLQFLIYECLKRGRVRSQNTWDSYAKHLSSFFSFCEDNEVDWRNIAEDYDSEDEMLLAVYRDACVDEFKISVNSTNQYLRTIVRFYGYAVGKGWVSSLPYGLESVKAGSKHSFLAHTVRNGNEAFSPDVIMKTETKRPEFLSSEEVQELLTAIKNPTLKLMVRLCLQTGIRRKELLLFPLNAIRKPNGNAKICKVTINRTKGEKQRVIHIPTRLMEDLWRYVNELRFQQQQESEVNYNYLFLTTDGQEWSVEGTGVNDALKALGLPFRVTPHMLRHTYATHMLKGLQAQNQSKFEPLMYLQERMGHASITTTMIYLHLVNDLMDDFSLEYQDNINAIV